MVFAEDDLVGIEEFSGHRFGREVITHALERFGLDKSLRKERMREGLPKFFGAIVEIAAFEKEAVFARNDVILDASSAGGDDWNRCGDRFLDGIRAVISARGVDEEIGGSKFRGDFCGGNIVLQLNAFPEFGAGCGAEVLFELRVAGADPEQFELEVAQTVERFEDDIGTFPEEKGADAQNAVRDVLRVALNG